MPGGEDGVIIPAMNPARSHAHPAGALLPQERWASRSHSHGFRAPIGCSSVADTKLGLTFELRVDPTSLMRAFTIPIHFEPIAAVPHYRPETEERA